MGRCSTASKGSRGNYNLEVEIEIVTRVQLDVRAAIPERQSSTVDDRGAAARASLHRAISGIGEVRVHRQVYPVPACEIGIEADGSQRGVPCQDCQAHDR